MSAVRPPLLPAIPPRRWRCWPAAWLAGFTAVIVGLTIAVVVVAMVVAGNQGSLQRYCVEATPERVQGGPGEPGGRLIGALSAYTNERYIEYDFQFTGLSTITAVHIRGPIPLGSDVGPFRFALCGTPSTMVCDVTTLPGALSGRLDQISPGGTSPKSEVLALRAEPWRYYLEVLTTNVPATPGAVRAPLDSVCGTP